MKVAAGIVTYNPEIETLRKNISAVISQVDALFIVNNGKDKLPDTLAHLLGDIKVKVVDNKDNLGIARALNQIVKMCIRDNAEWVMLLDQDSILAEGAIDKMLKVASEENASIVAPRIIDINKNKGNCHKKKVEEIDMAITSGSLVKVSDCKELGFFDERMFIDFVDFDYCKRVKLANKKIFRANSVKLIHEVGKRTKKKLLWLTLYPTNHNSTRVYYYARNIMYYRKKFKGRLNFKEKRYLFNTEMWKIASIILYEQGKREKLKSYFKGRKDGKMMIRKVKRK